MRMAVSEVPALDALLAKVEVDFLRAHAGSPAAGVIDAWSAATVDHPLPGGVAEAGVLTSHEPLRRVRRDELRSGMSAADTGSHTADPVVRKSRLMDKLWNRSPLVWAWMR